MDVFHPESVHVWTHAPMPLGSHHTARLHALRYTLQQLARSMCTWLSSRFGVVCEHGNQNARVIWRTSSHNYVAVSTCTLAAVVQHVLGAAGGREQA